MSAMDVARDGTPAEAQLRVTSASLHPSAIEKGDFVTLEAQVGNPSNVEKSDSLVWVHNDTGIILEQTTYTLGAGRSISLSASERWEGIRDKKIDPGTSGVTAVIPGVDNRGAGELTIRPAGTGGDLPPPNGGEPSINRLVVIGGVGVGLAGVAIALRGRLSGGSR